MQPAGPGRYAARSMAKTLLIAEKPSVGQDLARVLPGPFEKHTGAGERTTRWLEGPEHVVTWA
ncbi:MAG: topoisomerase, partial [Solirubrobacteraceae bacterium]|nr:topoisomerase [Solirubrobacteraceae bacterium]